MNENEQVNADTTNGTETTENDTTTEEGVMSKEEVEALKKENETLKAQKDHWRQKAEKKPNETTTTTEDKKADDVSMSPKDYLALNEAKVSSEDFDEVVRVAKILGKSISEALKDKTLKTILETRAEERKTALATQTKSTRPSTKQTGEALVEKAHKGEFPTEDADIQKLVEAEEATKRARLRK